MTARLDLLGRAGLRTADDCAENQCTAVGSDGPRDLRAIRVEFDCDHAGAAVLDLGCGGPRGYVGCSGGVRDDYLAAEWATPGYLPTPVAAGRWAVLVGLLRVPAPGAAFRVPVREATSAEVDAKRAWVPGSPPVPGRGPRRTLPGLDGLP